MSYSCKTLITTNQELASRDKRLSICLGANGFSFAVTTTSGTLLTFGEAVGTHAPTMTGVMTDAKALFASVGLRPLGYAASEIIVISNESVWVPDELFTATATRKYLKLVGSEPLSMMTCPCKELASTAVFAADEHVVTAFKVAVPGAMVMNQHTKMTQVASLTHNQPLILTHWREGRVDVAAFNEGRYLYGNTLSFHSDSEAVYQVVNVMKSFALEAPNCQMWMCGEVNRERYALARPYFPQVALYNGVIKEFLNPEFRNLHTYRHALILM